MVEAKQSIANERVVDQKPFVIRGHHLNLLRHLVSNPVTPPQRLARRLRTTLKMTRDASPYVWDRDREYGQDVIGTTTKSADKYEDSIRKVFERFVVLTDDHPTEIVEEMPDAICEVCVIGRHCRQITYHGEDGEHIDAFLRKISLFNLPKPVIVKEQLHFANSKRKQQVRRIKTTLGTVKKVLKEKSPYW